jgi:hypothetical protein
MLNSKLSFPFLLCEAIRERGPADNARNRLTIRHHRITKSEAVMDAKTKVRENRLRRMASRQGLRLEKSRQRDPMALDYGKYRLVNGRPGHIYVFIGQGDIDQVEEWLESGHRLNLR